MTLHELAEELFPPERRWLGLIIFVSLLAHFACFFIFRVEKPQPQSLGLRARQVTLLGTGTSGGGEGYLSWLYWRDPSAIALPQSPLPEPRLNQKYGEGGGEVPSMDPLPISGRQVQRNLSGGEIDSRVRDSISTTAGKPMAVPVEAPPALGTTTFRLSTGLKELGLESSKELPRPATGSVLKSTAMRVSVNGLGQVENVLVEESCGDSSVDELAAKGVRGWRFRSIPGSPPDKLTWGRISIFWYQDEKPAEGAK